MLNPKTSLLNWLKLRVFKRSMSPEISQAHALIRAIDRGGIPLNPARVNAIARSLGLEVSRHARIEETVDRIRACLRR
jgi:hypothetical protein